MSPPAPGEDQKKKAFTLYEQGQFAESFALCCDLMHGDKDFSVAVLAASNLFSMGRYDEAEAHFRDLATKMPESSHVHSYLGTILEKKGDEGAIAEYATAVVLDPGNLEALRRYSQYLISAGDDEGAIAPLKQLVSLSGKTEDISSLVGVLTRTGRAAEAITLHDARIGERGAGEEYLHALQACGQYRKAADCALAAYRQTGTPVFQRIHLLSLSKVDPGTARQAYADSWDRLHDPGTGYDFCRFLKCQGDNPAALDLSRDLRSRSDDREAMLLLCELLALSGAKDAAREEYERLIRAELESMADPAALGQAVSQYREFLRMYYPLRETLPRFLELVSTHANPVCLIATARFYEDLGDSTESRSWYYRAFRSDFLYGGIEYAQFLARHDDLRECEKCMLYILKNIRRTHDLVRLARVMAEDRRMRYGLKRFLPELLAKLDERVMNLGTDGLEVLAVMFLLAGTHAIEVQDYQRAKEYSLRGLDVLPPSSRTVHPGDLLALIEACKERTLSDRPVLLGRGGTVRVHHEGAAAPSLSVVLDLDEHEREILAFLQVHRRATEMDLRKVTGSRRVVGIVNRLIQKASAQGIMMIEKKGIGKDGEFYEYCGP